MAEYIRTATPEDNGVKRLEVYKAMLLEHMDRLMADVERLSREVEQIDQAIAEDTLPAELTEEDKFVRGTE